MTAKDAAEKAKHWGGRWITGPAAIWFAVGGFAAVIFSKQLPPGTDLVGLAMGIAGVVAKLSEATQKKNASQAAPVIAELVVQGLKSDIDKGVEDHAACMETHAEHGEAIVKLRADVNELTGEAVKAGWKLGLGN